MILTTKKRILLFVIGVLAFAAVVYFIVTKKSAAEVNRDEITLALQDIAAHAQTHFRRTDSFTGWVLPSSLKFEKIGRFREKVDYNQVKIFAVGTELGINGISNVNLEATITGRNLKINIRN
ncbi:MAG: hypothetical protein HXY50_09510 [Ignavibacteriaceae bacterium]|nr:hypothetical protein [Ignavibacteriaceae bacterium]